MKAITKHIYGLLFLTVLLLSLTSCGVETDEEASPCLKSAEVLSYCDGSEDSQYVQVNLIFDREIAVTEDSCESLRITIADKRIQEGEYTLSAGESSDIAQLKISVNAVTKGVLKIEKAEEDRPVSEIRSADEQYAVSDFELEAIIPSGVTLSTVSGQPGTVTKSVDSFWSIRSIAWIGLTEDGELIPVSETRPLEMLDGYAAVHGHEFLDETETIIAERMAEVLENNYSNEYLFSAEGNTITAQKPGTDAELDIVIYEYLKINGKGAEKHETE